MWMVDGLVEQTATSGGPLNAALSTSPRCIRSAQIDIMVTERQGTTVNKTYTTLERPVRPQDGIGNICGMGLH
jgi:hypothetical protein